MPLYLFAIAILEKKHKENFTEYYYLLTEQSNLKLLSSTYIKLLNFSDNSTFKLAKQEHLNIL